MSVGSYKDVDLLDSELISNGPLRNIKFRSQIRMYREITSNSIGRLASAEIQLTQSAHNPSKWNIIYCDL
jgi:hypothetical protein